MGYITIQRTDQLNMFQVIFLFYFWVPFHYLSVGRAVWPGQRYFALTIKKKSSWIFVVLYRLNIEEQQKQIIIDWDRTMRHHRTENPKYTFDVSSSIWKCHSLTSHRTNIHRQHCIYFFLWLFSFSYLCSFLFNRFSEVARVKRQKEKKRRKKEVLSLIVAKALLARI